MLKRGDYQVIPNGIDLDQFNPDVNPIEKYLDGKLNILFVGRLEKRKGVKYLIRAYTIVKEKYPDSRLIIVGPGIRFRRKYENMVKKDNLGDVVFLGNVPFEDLPRYYKTADVFCSPAVSGESFGIVLLEAMAVGTPIVATNIDGYASVLTNGKEGLLVPPRNSRELASAICKILSDRQLRYEMGARGILTSHEYDWRKVSQRIYEYYLKALNWQSISTSTAEDNNSKTFA